MVFGWKPLKTLSFNCVILTLFKHLSTIYYIDTYDKLSENKSKYIDIFNKKQCEM
jgi:hypothetical protein